MEPRDFMNTLSIALSFIAGLFFVLGATQMKAKDIEALSGTYWGYNGDFAVHMAKQKADYLSGGFIFCVAFFLQFTASVKVTLWEYFVPPTIDPSLGAGVAILAAASAALLGYLYRQRTVRLVLAQVEAARNQAADETKSG